MDRKKFLQNSLIIGGASVLPVNSLLAANASENGIDKLADKDGNFSQQALPYPEDFLEPYMDAETVMLHYTFHHGGAVKAANSDLKKIREALDTNSLETVDHWTKKLSYHFSSHILHTIFWTNLTNRQMSPTGELNKLIEKNFGSYDRLKTHISVTSKNIDGNGWGILGYQPYSDSLTVLQCENHEKTNTVGSCSFACDRCMGTCLLPEI